MVLVVEPMWFFISWSAVSRLNNNNQIASWDTKFETGTRTILLQPFTPVVIAADENERIRYANFLLLYFYFTYAVDTCLDGLII